MLRFRNLTVSPEDPVELWGTEGILTALERGTVFHWAQILSASKAEKVAVELNEALALCSRVGAKTWILLQLAKEKLTPEQKVAKKLSLLRARSGLAKQDFARKLGTSGSRLSTYLSGKVTPSAALMEVAEQLASESSGVRIRQK